MSAAKRAAKVTTKRGAERGAKTAPRAKTATKAPAKTAAARRPAGASVFPRDFSTQLRQQVPQDAARRAGERAEAMVLTGRGGARVWGTKHPAAQLTERQVIRFRRLVRAGKATVGELAAEVGCGHSRISMAVRGQTWAHLNEVAPPIG